MKVLLCVLFSHFCFLTAPVLGQAGGAIGSLPAATAPAAGEASQDVKPGDSHTNTDSVTTDCDKSSKGNAKVTPKVGTHDSASTVTCKSKFKGKVSGIDCNDTVNAGAKTDVEVSGSCGTVNVEATTAKVKVTNDGSGGNITVNKPDGTSEVVPPGGSTSYP